MKSFKFPLSSILCLLLCTLSTSAFGRDDRLEFSPDVKGVNLGQLLFNIDPFHAPYFQRNIYWRDRNQPQVGGRLIGTEKNAWQVNGINIKWKRVFLYFCDPLLQVTRRLYRGNNLYQGLEGTADQVEIEITHQYGKTNSANSALATVAGTAAGGAGIIANIASVGTLGPMLDKSVSKIFDAAPPKYGPKKFEKILTVYRTQFEQNSEALANAVEECANVYNLPKAEAKLMELTIRNKPSDSLERARIREQLLGQPVQPAFR